MKKLKNKYTIIAIVIAAISLISLFVVKFSNITTSNKTYVDFMKDVNLDKVSEVYVTGDPTIKVKLKSGTIYETDNPKNDNFKSDLLMKNIKVLDRSLISIFEVIPITTLSMSIFFIIFMFIKNSNLTSKKLVSSVDDIEASSVENPNYTFKDIAGNEEAKESVQDIIEFLKNPEKYSRYGARMPRGIILYGQPGTGKTLLAKAVAGEAGVPFYAMSGSDFIQIYVGVGASRIRKLFQKAKGNGKAVIFIDEIDAIGKKRNSSSTGGSDERDQTLNALLTEMSGFNESEGIIVMAATNRLDMLDPALLRPGRFDRHIEVGLPDVTAREKILSLHLKDKPTGNIPVHKWAQKTSYFSGAKIEHLINESAIIACKNNSEKIENIHIDKAFSIVLAGYEKINRNHISDKDRKITAYHESGHALVSLKMLPDEKVSKITIIPSTKGAGGYTMSIPKDGMYQNKEYLKRRIMIMLGGRAAEEIIFGEKFITTGAYNDLKQSTDLVFKMITEYGMGDALGLLSIQSLPSQISSSTNSTIILECKSLVNTLYTEVKELLTKESSLLENIAESLLQKETLYENDIEELEKNNINL